MSSQSSGGFQQLRERIEAQAPPQAASERSSNFQQLRERLAEPPAPAVSEGSSNFDALRRAFKEDTDKKVARALDLDTLARDFIDLLDQPEDTDRRTAPWLLPRIETVIKYGARAAPTKETAAAAVLDDYYAHRQDESFAVPVEQPQQPVSPAPPISIRPPPPPQPAIPQLVFPNDEDDDYLLYAMDTLTQIRADPWYDAGARDTTAQVSKTRQRRRFTQRMLLIYQFLCTYVNFPLKRKNTPLFGRVSREVTGMKFDQGVGSQMLHVQRLIIILIMQEFMPHENVLGNVFSNFNFNKTVL